MDANHGKTIVLRKGDQWYIFNSKDGDEREILMTLLNLAEEELYAFDRSDVMQLIEQLGWKLETHENLEKAG